MRLHHCSQHRVKCYTESAVQLKKKNTEICTYNVRSFSASTSRTHMPDSTYALMQLVNTHFKMLLGMFAAFGGFTVSYPECTLSCSFSQFSSTALEAGCIATELQNPAFGLKSCLRSEVSPTQALCRPLLQGLSLFLEMVCLLNLQNFILLSFNSCLQLKKRTSKLNLLNKQLS